MPKNVRSQARNLQNIGEGQGEGREGQLVHEFPGRFGGNQGRVQQDIEDVLQTIQPSRKNARRQPHAEQTVHV